MDIAKLGFVVDTSDAKRAEKDLDALENAAADLEKQFDKTTDGVKGASGRIQRALGQSAGKSAAAWGKFRDSLQGSGGLAAIAGTGAISLAVKRMIEEARAAGEAAALFDEVFKDSSASVRDWSKVMAKQINRSATDLQGQAALFQQVLAAMVPDRKQAAQMSQDLTTLAQDISAFYDISEGDAIGKLRSGLTGETEPLKALGIVLSATAVEAKALEMGLAKTSKELSEGDKVAARYALIMQLTADAQGAATREASSLSNVQKGLNGALRDAYRSLGENLLPIVTQMVSKLASLVQAFNSLEPSTQKFIAYAMGAAAAIGPVLTAVGLMSIALPPLAAAFGLLASPIGLAVIGIGLLTAAIVKFWPQIQSAEQALHKFASNAVKYVGDALRKLDAALSGLAQMAVEKVRSFANSLDAGMSALAQYAVGWGSKIVSRLGEGLASIVQAAAEAIRAFALSMAAGMQELAAQAVQWGVNLVQGIIEGIKQKAVDLKNAVTGMAQGVKEWFTGPVEIQSPSRVFMEYGGYLTQGLAMGINQGASEPLTAMRGVAQNTISTVDEFKSGLKSAFSSIIDGTKSVPEAFSDMFRSIADKFMNSGLDMLFGSLFGGGVVGNDALSNALRSALPSFAGGGYTWDGPRTGGLDGKGGRMAMLHPRETVIDHTSKRSASSGGAMTYAPTFQIGGRVTQEDLEAVRRESAQGFARMRSEVPSIMSNHQTRRA